MYCCISEAHEPVMALRTLTIHFGNNTQRLKFFPDSSRDELLDGIREIMALEWGTPLRFRDEDGDVVILTAGSIFR